MTAFADEVLPSSSELRPASFSINGRQIGAEQPAYIIAEMSANHGQDYGQALEIVRAAHWCGADAVKVQTYTPDSLTIDCDNAYFQIGAGSLWGGCNLYELYQEAQMPWRWHAPLQAEANALGMDFFSSPFDHDAVDRLETLGVPAYKIASFEIVDLPLIRRAARAGKPLIISTGMASESEIGEALTAARGAGNGGVALLKCTSAYPAPPEEMNLRAIERLAHTFGVPVGLSDHSMDIAVPVTAVALGACIVEKHLTLSRDIPGPDSAFSLEPAEFKAMTDAIRVTQQALGCDRLGLGVQEAANHRFRRSLFVVQDIRAGEGFTDANVRIIRPGHGLAPRCIEKVLGQTAACDITRGTPLQWNMVQT